MSAQFVDGLINEFLGGTSKKWQTVLRKHYAGQFPHVIKITKGELEDIFTHNVIYAIHHDKDHKQIYKQYKVKTAKQKQEQEAVEEYRSSSDYSGEGEGLEQMLADIPEVTPEQQIDAAKRLMKKVEGDVKIAGKKAAAYVFKNFGTIFKPKANREFWEEKGVAWKLRGPVRVEELRNELVQPILKAGLPIISKALEKNRPEYAEALKTKEAHSKASRRTQFLHEGGTTLGATHIRKLINSLHNKQMDLGLGNGSLDLQTTVALKTVEEIFGPYRTKWKKIPDIKKNPTGYPTKYSEETHIEGSIGSNVMNPSGSEASDWKKLRPKLEKALIEEWKNHPSLEKFATKEGSKSFVQRLGERASKQIGDDFVKSCKGKKHVKVRSKQNFKETKPKKSKSEFTRKGKKARFKGKGIKRKRSSGLAGAAGAGNRTVNKRKVGRSDLELMALINASLTEEVINNMGGRRLNNITGKFAESVEVLKITGGRRGQGMRNIIYGYEMEPYGVFEPGIGKRPWATPSRNPVTLIDLSIREVAKKLALMKFITTRL